MTDEEALQQLRELGEEIAATETSPWEPRTISRAWASLGAGDVALTMQGWIDLDAMRSPILDDQFPPFEELERAAAAFGVSLDELDAVERAHVANAMRRAVRRAFGASLSMTPPEQIAAATLDTGFGQWMPLFAFLVVQCGLGVAEALAMRVEAAFTLQAGHRRNQGWTVAGTSYALRDMEGAP